MLLCQFVLCGSTVRMGKVRAVPSVMSRKKEVRLWHGRALFLPSPSPLLSFSVSIGCGVFVLQGRLYAFIVIAPLLPGDGKWEMSAPPHHPPLMAAIN